jgi:DNA-binding response OmpR family regulator
MKRPQILIVDDDAELQGVLASLFDDEGWHARSALSMAQAEQLLASHQPAVVVLDMMLRDGSGLDLCRRWRYQHPALNILMLSARSDPLDKVLGREVGADDYRGKPVERRELVARVRALLRRQGVAALPLPPPAPPVAAAAASARLELEGLAIDMLQREVLIGGEVVPLTAMEFKVLLVLVQAPGRVLPRDVLNQAVQVGNHRPLDRTMDVRVGRVRRKLQAAAPGNEWIVTIRGEGYLFVAPVCRQPRAGQS